MKSYQEENVHLKGIHLFSDFLSNPIPFKQPNLYKPIPFQLSQISSYLQIMNRKCQYSFEVFEVMPTDKLIDFVKENMLAIDYDSIYFEIICYENNTAMLIAKYNQIIGSRWIAMIDINSIPK